MSEKIEAILRGAGLTDEPGEFDGNIHSWRCEHPNVYGKCDCSQSLVADLAAHDREVAAEALTGFVKCVSERVEDYMSVATLKALAATYQDKETSDA